MSLMDPPLTSHTYGIQFWIGINMTVQTSNENNIVLTTRHREHNYEDRKECSKKTVSR